MFGDEGGGVTFLGFPASQIPPVGAEATSVVASYCDGRDGARGDENGLSGLSCSHSWEKKGKRGAVFLMVGFGFFVPGVLVCAFEFVFEQVCADELLLAPVLVFVLVIVPVLVC